MLNSHADKLNDDGHRRLVRHGHLPEREIATGIGPVVVRCLRVRDRGRAKVIVSVFQDLPPYARRSKSLEVLIPVLYLKGVSTGDFEEALLALLGKDAGGLSASTIARLKDAWSDEHLALEQALTWPSDTGLLWADLSTCRPRLEDDSAPAGHHRCYPRRAAWNSVGLIDGVREEGPTRRRAVSSTPAGADLRILPSS